MGLLVFQQSSGGTINVQGTNTASTYTWTIPASTDTFVGLAATQTLTNKTLTTPVINTFGSASSTNLLLQTNGGTTAITIDTAQNVGVGVTPSAWGSTWKGIQFKSSPNFLSGGTDLNVLANAYNDGTNYKYIDSYAYASRYYQYNGQHQWHTTTSTQGAGNSITFTQAMTLTNSNNLLVGTTTDNGQPLQILYSGSSLSTTATFRNSSSTTNNQYGNVQYLTGDPNNGTNYFYACIGNSTNRILLYSNGGIGNYATNNVIFSDETLKKNITPAKNYLNILNQLQVVTYLFNDQTDNELNLGVIAQQVQPIAPELVTTINAGTLENPDEKLGIYDSDLKYAMLKAIQELSAQVIAQATTISTMQAALKAANITGF